MLKVPIDVWKVYLYCYLDPQALSRLGGICRRFHGQFEESISVYRGLSTDDALRLVCLEGHRSLAEWLIAVKGATELNGALRGAIYDWWSPSVSRVVD